MTPPNFPRPQIQNKQKLTHAQLVLPRDRLSSSEKDPCVSVNWQLQRWWEASPARRLPSARACLVPVSSRDMGVPTASRWESLKKDPGLWTQSTENLLSHTSSHVAVCPLLACEALEERPWNLCRSIFGTQWSPQNFVYTRDRTKPLWRTTEDFWFLFFFLTVSP